MRLSLSFVAASTFSGNFCFRLENDIFYLKGILKSGLRFNLRNYIDSSIIISIQKSIIYSRLMML